MHLLRVQIPKFRALENVDITFEKEFVPRIFPVGSLNGGGKSTLLQLIFTLLHCSGDPQKTPYLANLLDYSPSIEDSSLHVFATFEFIDGDKLLKVEFCCCNVEYIGVDLPDNFKVLELESTIHQSKEYLLNLENIKLKLLDLKKGNNLKDKKNIKHLLDISNTLNRKLSNVSSEIDWYFACDFLIDAVNNDIKELTDELFDNEHYLDELKDDIEKIEKKLLSDNLIFITNFLPRKSKKDHFLYCRIGQLGEKEVNKTLRKISQKIFLMSPSTQLYLFLKSYEREKLYRKPKNDHIFNFSMPGNYEDCLQKTKEELPNFSTFDFIAVDFIAQMYKQARDKDFLEAMNNQGQYGNNLNKLSQILSALLGAKRINFEPDLSNIILQVEVNNQFVDVSLEDLSHGESRRLSIFAWLYLADKQDAIILIDEIEIGLHPDWQFQIVRDLQEWAPHSQFILATHSYDVCEALTRAHVKELNPQLIKQIP